MHKVPPPSTKFIQPLKPHTPQHCTPFVIPMKIVYNFVISLLESGREYHRRLVLLNPGLNVVPWYIYIFQLLLIVLDATREKNRPKKGGSRTNDDRVAVERPSHHLFVWCAWRWKPKLNSFGVGCERPRQKTSGGSRGAILKRWRLRNITSF